jgi:hypothetical protein
MNYQAFTNDSLAMMYEANRRVGNHSLSSSTPPLRQASKAEKFII